MTTDMVDNFNKYGGYFAPPGYLKVETGGSHDENPNGGVQIGVDSNGVPNMLEEGEPVYDDYVYSDNITADKAVLEQFHIPEKYAGKLYSEIADTFVDEAEDRPLDPISNNGLRAMLGRLADAQEQQKQNQEQKELEDELANMSPEELAELEAMLGQQEEAGEQVIPEQGIPTQQPVMPVMANGGLIRRFDEGTPGKVTNSGGAGHSGGGTGGGTRETEIRIPSILEMALGSDNKIVQANNRFQDWLHDSTMGRIIDAVVPDSAMGAFVPAIKPAAGVSKIMDEAYRALEAEKAYEGAYRGAEVAGEAASAAKNSGIGKKIWNVAKYFVDPSAVWRSGWRPQSFLGKAAKGVVGGLHSGTVGGVEADVIGSAIGKGIDISKSSKTEEFEFDPFSGRKYARGGNLFWPGGGINTTNFFGNYFPAFRFNTTGIGSMGYPGALPVSSGAASGQQKPKVEAIAAGDPNIGGMNRVVYTGPKPTISTKPYQMGVNVADTDSSFPTWTRYAGALGHGLLALGNAVTPQTRFTSRQARPYYPTGRINLIDPTYNPIDFGLTENAILASGAGTVGALRNAGLGPSTAASIIAADKNIGQNLGVGFLQNWNANNQQRNDVIAARNSNATQRANFNYQVEAARAQALDNAQRFNIQNDLYLQRLNDNAESQKYAAISGELGYGLDALTKMGDENMAFNMVNSTSDYGYDDKSGRVRYKRRASNGGTLLKKYKK